MRWGEQRRRKGGGREEEGRREGGGEDEVRREERRGGQERPYDAHRADDAVVEWNDRRALGRRPHLHVAAADLLARLHHVRAVSDVLGVQHAHALLVLLLRHHRRAQHERSVLEVLTHERSSQGSFSEGPHPTRGAQRQGHSDRGTATEAQCAVRWFGGSTDLLRVNKHDVDQIRVVLVKVPRDD